MRLSAGTARATGSGLNRTSAGISPREWAVYALFAALAFAASLACAWRGMAIVDISQMLDRSYRLSIGQVPYRDFFALTPPVTFLMQALGFKLFGVTTVFCKYFIAVENTLFCLLALYFCKKFLRLPFGALLYLMPVILVWSPGLHLPMPWYDNDPFLFGYLQLFALCAALYRPENKALPLLAGLFAGLCFLTKQNVGALAIASGLPFFWLQDSPLKFKFRQILVYGAGCLLPFALFFAFQASQGAFKETIDWLLVYPFSRQSAYRGSFISRFYLLFFDMDRKVVKLFFLVYFAAVYFGWKLDRREPDGRRTFLFTSTALFVLACHFGGTLSQVGGNFYYQQAFLGVALGILFLAASEFVDWMRWVPRAAALGLLALFVLTNRIAHRWNICEHPVPFPRLGGIYAPMDYIKEAEIHLEADRMIPKEDSVFVYPNSCFHVLTGRRHATRTTSFDQGLETTQEDLQDIIRTLEEKKVGWVLYNPMTFLAGNSAFYKPLFEDYVPKHYETVWTAENFPLDSAAHPRVKHLPDWRLMRRKT